MSRQKFGLGTWLDPEEFAYPAGTLKDSRRKFKAQVNGGVAGKDYITGIAGIPDTAFTVPARGRWDGKTVSGYLDVGGPLGTAEGVLIFNFGKKRTIRTIVGQPDENPGDRVVHVVGAYVVTYNTEVEEYRAYRKGASKDEGYFTSDKQDAIDTAEVMARIKHLHEDAPNPRHYDRRHPGYKGANIQIPEDRFAYRGYSVQLGSDRETWYISKDGVHIGSAPSANGAREVIADLTQGTYGGER
jgi:hypothetical protein